ncbi:MAG: hypothetical protein ACYC2O_13240, partial [Microthrixaceae bacterium]
MTDHRDDDAPTDEPVPDVDGEGGEPQPAEDADDDLSEDADAFLESEDVQLEEGQLAYDCAAWAGESRGLFESLLTSHEIPHAWQGTTVTVREEDEDRVDDLVDDVLASARPALDPRVPKLVYEVSLWPVALQTELVDQLTAADVPYEWDERGDLVVRESDEAEVEGVLELLPDPDEESVSSDDGVAVHEVLDQAFMAADRLVKHATDASATVQVVDATDRLEQLALPFGFEPAQWRRLVGAAQALREAIVPPEDAEPVADATISELA